jgi:4-hydroxy-tetrahydrodipicolinate synthase
VLAPLIAAKVDSIGLLGSTGTYPYLTREERRRAIDTAVEAAAGQVPILVGVGALRTDEAVRLAQDAQAAGAACGLLAPVSYAPLQDDEVFEHYATVARESRLPICIYDNFNVTHFKFTPALIGRLGQIAGVVALKGSAPDPQVVAAHHAALSAALPAGFSIGYAADWNVTEALLAGGTGWYSVAGGLFPKACLAIMRAVEAGDAAEARRLNAAMQPLWDLFKEFSGLRTVYALAGMMGLCEAEPPRPILPLPEPARRKVAATLSSLNLS